MTIKKTKLVAQEYPEKALKWFRKYRAKLTLDGLHDPYLRTHLMAIIQFEAKSTMSLPDNENADYIPSVDVFRTLHCHYYSPDTNQESVGHLPIDDELFFDLICNEIETVNQLQKILDQSSEVEFRTGRSVRKPQDISSLLTKALRRWLVTKQEQKQLLNSLSD